MNDKVKLFVLAGIFFLAINRFYFLLMRNAGQTDSSQIEKASVSQGGKTVKKTEVSKDADLHEIYLAGGMFLGSGGILLTCAWSDGCRFRLC